VLECVRGERGAEPRSGADPHSGAARGDAT
jgi:hypothetical protein